MLRNLVFILIFYFISTSVFSQNTSRYIESSELYTLNEDAYLDVQITNYLFRKVDTNYKIVEFTPLDALKLEQFFMLKKGVLSCETHALNKTAKIVSHINEPNITVSLDFFDPIAAMEELKTMGYVISSFRSTQQNMFFEARNECEQKRLRAIKAGTANSDKDCTDCGEIKVSQDVLDKFKNVDYGGKKVIDFNSIGTNKTTPVTTETTPVITDKD
jgi:hypothetical protein